MVIQPLLLTLLAFQNASFIEQSIVSANEEIAKEPGKPDGYNDLAMAMVRKERQTGDPSYLRLAESAIQKSLLAEPANFAARRARVAVRLTQHRFEDALEEAEALRTLRPDDNPIYGFISQAQIALGNYPAAEKAVQRMLDLRSVNGPGFEYGAIVREFIGFPGPAIDWWTSALHLVSDRDGEERAFIYSNMARIYRETGRYDAGAESAQRAFELEPDYPLALLELARIRIEQKQPDAAAELLRKRYAKCHDLESLYWLSAVGGKAGDAFETQARAAATLPMNANALLIRYLAEHGKSAEAISIAGDSLQRRPDLFTREAYAIALSKAGRNADAFEQIKKALEPGFQDAGLFFDAGVMAKAVNERGLAEGYFKKAFEMGVNGLYSSEILKQLASLESPSPN
jgi:tetratricopeptide (TPR) repeat protein